jgi:hypothetical protein
MTKREFAGAIAWLSGAIGKQLADNEAERQARLEIYFECLGDLPLDAFRVACKRCAMERKYQSFPPIAELRELATETKRGEVQPMTGAEAFGIALNACGNCDNEVDGSIARAFTDVPPAVQAAIKQFGFMTLYNLPNNAIEIARAQFTKLYDAVAERERKTGLLPPGLVDEIGRIGQRRALPSEEPLRIGAVLTEMASRQSTASQESHAPARYEKVRMFTGSGADVIARDRAARRRTRLRSKWPFPAALLAAAGDRHGRGIDLSTGRGCRRTRRGGGRADRGTSNENVGRPAF